MTPKFLRSEANRFRGMAEFEEREASKLRLLRMAAEYESMADAANQVELPHLLSRLWSSWTALSLTGCSAVGDGLEPLNFTQAVSITEATDAPDNEEAEGGNESRLTLRKRGASGVDRRVKTMRGSDADSA